MWNLLNPNTDFYENHIDKGRFRLAWRVTLFFTFIFVVLTGITLMTNKITAIFYGTVLVLSIITLFVLHKMKKYRFTYWIFSISASVLVIISMNTIPETMHYSDFLWVLCIILFAYVGMDKKIALFFVFVHLVAMGYYVFFRLNNHFLELQPRDDFQLSVALIEILFALFVMGHLVDQHTRFQNFAESEWIKANNQLKQQFDLIQSKNEENKVLIKEVHHRVKITCK